MRLARSIPPSTTYVLTRSVHVAVYQASDAPRYKKGNSILLGITALNLIVICECGRPRREHRPELIALRLRPDPGVGFYYKWRNAQKAKKWNALSTEGKRECESALTAFALRLLRMESRRLNCSPDVHRPRDYEGRRVQAT